MCVSYIFPTHSCLEEEKPNATTRTQGVQALLPLDCQLCLYDVFYLCPPGIALRPPWLARARGILLAGFLSLNLAVEIGLSVLL
jgi:hypothetical protein